MNRFMFYLIWIGWSGIIFYNCSGPSTKESNRSKPNIVFILIENISTELSCYGEPLVHTPNIDRLSSEGVRFNQAYTTSSVCAPSRAAMMTGAYQIKTNTQNLRMNSYNFV